MKKYLPLLLVLVLLTGCSVFNFRDKVAVEKTMMNLQDPMHPDDTKLFPELENIEESVSERRIIAKSALFEGKLEIGQWEKEISTININGVDATAVVKWKYPIKLTYSVNEITKNVDLSLYGEGTYSLTKDSDGTWTVSSYPLFTWKNAYGPEVGNISISSQSNSLSAVIPTTANIVVVGALNKELLPLPLPLLADETNNTIYSRSIIAPIRTEDKLHGMICAITLPKDTHKYGITIAYFDVTAL